MFVLNAFAGVMRSNVRGLELRWRGKRVGLGERVTARKVCGFLLFLFARASGGSEAFVERGLWC